MDKFDEDFELGREYKTKRKLLMSTVQDTENERRQRMDDQYLRTVALQHKKRTIEH